MISRRDFLVSLAVAAAAARAGACAEPPGIVAESPLPVSQLPCNAFAADLYSQLSAESTGQNLFLSPYSIHVALAMTAAGARANTLAEMAKVLHLGPADERTHLALGKLIERINVSAQGPKGALFELMVANRLWGIQGYPYRADFLDLLKKHYGADLEAVNFADGEKARRTINAWVEQQTRDKIKDLIPAGALTELTRLVLTNAVYFKGKWAAPFDADQTHTQPFNVTSDKTVEVSLMQRSGDYRMRDMEDMQILELPYTSARLSMFVMLPKKVDGLPDVEKQLRPEFLERTLTNLPSGQVQVFLPRFKLESSFSLPQTLKKLGMVDAFDDRSADLSGIATVERGLYISDVVHKAYVDVDEQGTEAAAATGVVVGVRAAPIARSVFRADHPFAFLIRHNASGAILFQGRVTNPAA